MSHDFPPTPFEEVVTELAKQMQDNGELASTKPVWYSTVKLKPEQFYNATFKPEVLPFSGIISIGGSA